MWYGLGAWPSSLLGVPFPNLSDASVSTPHGKAETSTTQEAAARRSESETKAKRVMPGAAAAQHAAMKISPYSMIKMTSTITARLDDGSAGVLVLYHPRRSTKERGKSKETRSGQGIEPTTKGSRDAAMASGEKYLDSDITQYIGLLYTIQPNGVPCQKRKTTF